MNHPRIFVNFVLVTSPLNLSLRPHIHRSVHLTVTLNKKSNLKKVSSFWGLYQSLPVLVVQSYTNRSSLSRTLLLRRYWKLSVGIFLRGKRTIDSLTFQAYQLQQALCAPLWLPICVILPHPKFSTHKQNKAIALLFVQTIRSTHERFIQSWARNRRNNRWQQHERCYYKSLDRSPSSRQRQRQEITKSSQQSFNSGKEGFVDYRPLNAMP